MLHRVFVAINLPEQVKEKLISFRKDYEFLPCKWVEKENLHITVLFLGNLDDNQLFQTIRTTKQALKNYHSFLVEIDRVCYGPKGKFPPRMLWAEISKNKEFLKIRDELRGKLFSLPEYQYKTMDFKKGLPHITIARIKSFKFRNLESKPEIDIPLNIKLEVNSIEVMESEFSKKGSKYTILESIKL